jgi:hypothetical protein
MFPASYYPVPSIQVVVARDYASEGYTRSMARELRAAVAAEQPISSELPVALMRRS